MTQNNLFLHRLIVVTADNRIAYDEVFHRGVNIIRGQNSSGKSTILRFIFFVLGGCYNDFVPEALKCKYVVAEVEINGSIITIKRRLERTIDGRVNKKAPMYLYFGSIEQYKSDGRPNKWQKYGYMTTSERRSFSNVLFELMGLPEFRAESNITMHQILRLMYIDQESPLSSLFFFEQFDMEITREVVAELLMGLYNERLSESKLELIDVNKQIDGVKQSIKITREFLSDPSTQSSSFILEKISNLTNEINAITEEVSNLRQRDIHSSRSIMEYQRLKDNVAEIRAKVVSTENDVSALLAEIQDSRYFVDALNSKIEALNHSINTRGYFDSIHIEYCPECLTKIDQEANDGHCRLCKSPIDKSKGQFQAMRIKLELEFQVRESLALLRQNQIVVEQKEAELKSLRRGLKALQRQYDSAVRNVRSTRDEMIDNLIQTKGYKEGEIIQFRTLLETAEKYEALQKKLADLIQRKEELTRYIDASETSLKKDKKRIEHFISENGVFLLNNDQDRQTEFMHATDFVVDFRQNLAYITNQYIKLSASSSFYLKMAARFALFFSSLQVDSMKYPRFLFSDNMEDKGMEVDRAKNFQRVVIKRLESIKNPDFQLIFATSNIAEEYNKEPYVVGDYYTEDNKSLKNVVDV